MPHRLNLWAASHSILLTKSRVSAAPGLGGTDLRKRTTWERIDLRKKRQILGQERDNTIFSTGRLYDAHCWGKHKTKQSTWSRTAAVFNMPRRSRMCKICKSPFSLIYLQTSYQNSAGKSFSNLKHPVSLFKCFSTNCFESSFECKGGLNSAL